MLLKRFNDELCTVAGKHTPKPGGFQLFGSILDGSIGELVKFNAVHKVQ